MKIKAILYALLLVVVSTSQSFGQEKIIILNEGNWQTDNGQVTYFENGQIVSNRWFRDVNGYKLGDTPTDIIQIKQDLIAISVNWSNLIQYIDQTGHAVAATEDIPNLRKLATDGTYVYVTSYAHECMVNGSMKTFTKGFVAKVDTRTFKVVNATEVGYEPEGIAFYKGYIFVANTGGYAFQEDHEYESTVSVIKADNMSLVRNIETNQINLYGKLSQTGPYLCVNSAGDSYDVPAATIILDCDAVLDGKSDQECFVKLDYAATYNTPTRDSCFYAVGSRYSYNSGEYQFNYITIDPAEVIRTKGQSGVINTLPGSLVADFKKMSMPYGIYVNPYTGYIYATDAASNVGAGKLYQWNPEGQLLGTNKVYINSAHFLALPPDGHFTGLDPVVVGEPEAEGYIYDLRGIRVIKPLPGNVYIIDGKKVLYLH